MKCIRCGRENRLRVRRNNGGRCSRCNHRFVFEPTTASSTFKKVTDAFFKSAIQKISANNTLFFTFNQFLYWLNRNLLGISSHLHPRYRSNNSGCLSLLSLIVIIMTTIFLDIFLPAFIAILCGISIASILLNFFDRLREQHNWAEQNRKAEIDRQKQQAEQTRDRFLKGKFTRRLVLNESTLQDWIRRWQAVNGQIEKLLQPIREEFGGDAANPDVTAYSFDRLIVCQSDAIALMLIANRFHFENNCAILSINGYPQRIFNTVMEMVRRNSDLQVYALHDCSPEGIAMLRDLRTSDRWFPSNEVAIVDVGLHPRQVIHAARSCRTGRDFKLFVEQSSASARVARQRVESGTLSSSHFSDEELEWLTEGYFVSLESFAPITLIQGLRRSIYKSRMQSDIEENTPIFIADDISYIDADDSFG